MKSKSKVLFTVILCLLFTIFLISAIVLISYFIQSKQSQATYNELAAIVDAVRSTAPTEADDIAGSETVATPPSPFVEVADPTGNTISVLREYAPAYQLNSHMVGWLTIDGTNINYPVVQTPDSADYYLRRDFYGNRDTHGCIYAAEICDINTPSDNITLYGHRMRDGTMFAELSNYSSKEFWQSYPLIRFDTLFEHHTYQIAYVIVTESTVGKGFQYQNYTFFSDSAELQEFIDYCQALRLYDTGVELNYGDKLLTLSTCDYSLTNGRLVVIAKRIH